MKFTKLMILTIVVLPFVFVTVPEVANATSSSSKKPTLEEKATQRKLRSIVNKYSSARQIEIKVKKSFKLSALEKVKNSEGVLFISGEKIRFEIEKPDKSIIVIDGKNVWVADYAGEEFGGGVRVIKAKGNTKKQPLVASLFGKANMLDKYDVEAEKVEGDFKTYTLRAKNETDEVTRFTLKYNSKEDRIVQLSYLDKAKNETVFDFLSEKTSEKIDKKLFSYTPPKGAEVTVE